MRHIILDPGAAKTQERTKKIWFLCLRVFLAFPHFIRVYPQFPVRSIYILYLKPDLHITSFDVDRRKGHLFPLEMLHCCCFDICWLFWLFSRMRSEGFPFYSLGVWGWRCVRWTPFRCSRAFTTFRNRPQPFVSGRRGRKLHRASCLDVSHLR